MNALHMAAAGVFDPHWLGHIIQQMDLGLGRLADRRPICLSAMSGTQHPSSQVWANPKE